MLAKPGRSVCHIKRVLKVSAQESSGKGDDRGPRSRLIRGSSYGEATEGISKIEGFTPIQISDCRLLERRAEYNENKRISEPSAMVVVSTVWMLRGRPDRSVGFSFRVNLNDRTLQLLICTFRQPT